ncbi:hypothetical protein GCM10008959_19800 [Deinococcus seoulensis]|uniref:Diguanylate cyclase n=1 Tax=Deinococcus seoulensis TaxID=1837379 RepID=A0ABQ2RST5_9DEIO|nr:diguanylate cyclase [Deinococcus seoulensis]GGR58094.1 hypothetical protein GCM10008959_19800 [Deinococcus seoulensis]
MLTILLSNLGLVALFSYALGLTYRSWPPTQTPRDIALRTLLGVIATLALALHGGPGGHLYLIPLALLALRYGPLPSALGATPVILTGLLLPDSMLPGTRDLLLDSVTLTVLGTLLSPHLRLDLPPDHHRLWWGAPLLFAPTLLISALTDRWLDGPGGAAWTATPGLNLPAELLISSVSVVLLHSALHSRLHLLRVSATFRAEAHTDVLTGLSNRRQFDQDLPFLQPGDHLLVMDLDHFKRVNDEYGHTEGDAVLRRVARLLRGTLRPGDPAYRIGGEEFAVILRATPTPQAETVALRCLNAVRQWTGDGPAVTLSAGLACHAPNDTPLRTHQRADEALYAAKEGGRDGLRVSPPAPDAAPLTPELSLRAALTHFQSLHDPGPDAWHDLLLAACQSIPGAETGSLHVVEQGDFVTRAQMGLPGDLLGQRVPPNAQRAWHGGPDDHWLGGHPRVLRGYAIGAAARAASAAAFQPASERTHWKARLEGVTETLGVPVTADGHVIAYLNFDRSGPGVVFGAATQEVAVGLAAQVAPPLAPRARREREAQRTRELEALVQISAALRDARTSGDVTHAINSMAHVALNARQTIFMRYDPASDTLVSSLREGLPAETPTLSLRRGHGLSWAAVTARDVIRVNNMDADPRIVRVAGVANGASMLAPLQTADRLLGVLIVIRTHPFGENDAQLARALAAQGVTALERTERIRAIEQGREGILAALGRALEARDFETRGHTTRVLNLTLQVARRMNLSPDQLEALRDGAYLHDLGKVQVPDAVLLKPGPLNADEWAVMRQHAQAGEELARHIPGFSRHALQVIRHHHERWDGSGYPDGLSGAAIPLLARIFTVCDVFDALTSARPYKRGWSVPEALAEIRCQSGAAFDPQVVQAFLEYMNGSPTLPSRGGPASIHPNVPRTDHPPDA